jgi:hypothetical protein
MSDATIHVCGASGLSIKSHIRSIASRCLRTRKEYSPITQHITCIRREERLLCAWKMAKYEFTA